MLQIEEFKKYIIVDDRNNIKIRIFHCFLVNVMLTNHKQLMWKTVEP